jgi:uncharacterized protein YycO
MRIEGQPEVDSPLQILTPITSKEPPAVWTPSYNPQAGFTCENCSNRIYDPNPDYVRIPKAVIRNSDKSDHKTIALHLPSRCKRCDGIYTRHKRMQRRTKKIWDYCQDKVSSWYRMPKLITFNLDSGKSELAEATVEMKQLKKKMRQAKEILSSELKVKGGTYVLESTSKLYGFRSGEDWVEDQAFMAFSHHAHCHMVGVAPYIAEKKLPEKSQALKKIGLGTINYLAVRNKKQVSSYITKYLTKGKTRSVTWGCLRNTTK